MRNENGSGTAIGVVMTFPMLMLIIIVVGLLAESGRIDQVLQHTANRAARTAALCCHNTGGPDGAVDVAQASIAAAETAASFNQVFCNNDVIADSRIVFVDVAGNDVAVHPHRPVPSGGTVHVFLRCRVPPQILGGFGIPGIDATRWVEGVAVVDPFRTRSGG